MKNTYEYNLTVPSLFSRFIVGFASGFVGMIVLAILFFSTWNIVGSTLSPISPDTEQQLGIQASETQTHPLFLEIILLAIFLSTMAANITYTFLSTIVYEEFTRKSTALTQVFFGNLVFLILLLPVYFSMNSHFGIQGIVISAVMHVVITSLFTFFVLQALHQSKYLVVNLYGNLFGLLLFAFLVTFFYDMDKIAAIFLAFPCFFGIMALGNRIVELLYAWFYRSYGVDFLNVDTRFGDDYGVKDGESLKDEFDI